MEKRMPLSGNTLKILAAIFMTVDHIGLLFFPNEIIFRIIGRLAFPIFAFMIAEGARYTRHRLKYFLSVFILGLICQIVYFVTSESLYMCILITFSLSLLILFSFKDLKAAIFVEEKDPKRIAKASLLFALSIALAYVGCEFLEIDYGFAGIMAPLFASVFDFHGIDAPKALKSLDKAPLRVLCFAIGILMHAVTSGIAIQFYALLAIIPLILYSGKRGKYNMKYFFYIFYPLHLVLLYGILLLTFII